MLSVIVTIVKFVLCCDIIGVAAFTLKIHVTELLQDC